MMTQEEVDQLKKGDVFYWVSDRKHSWEESKGEFQIAARKVIGVSTAKRITTERVTGGERKIWASHEMVGGVYALTQQQARERFRDRARERLAIAEAAVVQAQFVLRTAEDYAALGTLNDVRPS